MAKIKIPTVNEKLLERYIRHAVYLEQLKKGEAKLISRFLKTKAFPQIYGKLIGELGKVKNLETVGSIYRIKRLKMMLASVQKISTAGMVKAQKMLVSKLVDISKFEAKWNANLIAKTVPLDITMEMPSTEVLKKLVTMRPMDGHKLGTWMAGFSTSLRIAMAKQIKVGIATGESLPKIGKRIEKVLGYKSKQAEYIARTAVSNVVHGARDAVFKANKELIRKIQWISTLDDRTSLVCIHYDGQVFDVDAGPRPPIHFNCRSSIAPVITSWQEYGVEEPPPATRASMNGAVPSKMTYRQWLKNMGKTAEGRATQNKILGKKRAELYRSGKVKIDKFIGKDLKPLTLRELAKREGIDLAAPIQPTTVVTRGIRHRVPETTVGLRSPGEPKVNTFFTETTSPEFRKIAKGQLNKIPDEIADEINNAGIRYKFGNKMCENGMFPELKLMHPRGYAPGATFDSVEGLFNLDAKSIGIAETFQFRGTKAYVTSTIKRIKGGINHETGHALDFARGRISNSTTFKAAYKKDLLSINKNEFVKRRIKYYLQSGEAGRQETFAELFAQHLGEGASKSDLIQLFPNCSKHVDDILKGRVVTKIKAAGIAEKPAVVTDALSTKLADPKIKNMLRDYDRYQKTRVTVRAKAMRDRLATEGVWIDDAGKLTTDATRDNTKFLAPKLKQDIPAAPPVKRKPKIRGGDFKNAHEDYRDLMSTQLDKLAKKYPAAKRKINSIEIPIGSQYKKITKSNSGIAEVITKGKKETIYFNGKWFGIEGKIDANFAIKGMHKRKWMVSESVEDIVTHEYGHVFLATRPEIRRSKLLNWWIFDVDATTMRKIKTQISRYATESSNEAFAEAFTQWQKGKASPMAKKILRIAGVLR